MNATNRIATCRVVLIVPLENDSAVTIHSARYPGFLEINSYHANHASILCPQAGMQPVFCAAIASPMVDILTNIQKGEKNVNVQTQ
jgi:hypothetical protein